MINTIRIKCPDTDISKEERINIIVEKEFRPWLLEPMLKRIIQIFDPSLDFNDTEKTCEILYKIKKFVEEHWDYRKKQREATTQEGEAARWLLQSEQIIEENSKEIIECAQKLGLIGVEETVLKKVDYILPLGGARMSNLRRTELARQIIDKNRLTNTKVVALSGMRPLNESEMAGYIDTYAPNAKFEFEAISTGLELAFKCGKLYEEEKNEPVNPNACYVLRHYKNSYIGNDIYSIAAPSSEPEKRRANSADCFEFFFQKFNIPKGTHLLNSTSQIYCSYQQIRALAFAIKYDVVFDTVGFPFALNNPDGTVDPMQLSKPVNYLQELKSSVDAMYDFVKEFLN